ncbi:MAG: SDR family NAD(P)-dependent oxidoreductase [Vicinamibacterales bacterium]
MYRLYESIGMSYGPSHRGIVAMHVGRDEVLARLSLPASVGLSTGDCVLHPGLLDSAVQAAIGLAIDRGEPIASLPFCLDEVVIGGACPSEGWVLVTSAPGRGAGSPAPTCDIQICDDDGSVRVVLKGLSTRPGAVGESAGAPDVLLLCPDWTAEPAVTSADAEFEQHVVVLCELDRIAPEDVQETLQRSWGNASVTCTAFHGSAERIDLRYASHAERLVALLAGILQAKPAASVLVQLAYRREGDGRMFRGLSGLLKTACVESTRLVCQAIGVDGDPGTAFMAAILEGNARCWQDQEVEYRSQARLVMQWRELQHAATEERAFVPWRPGGTYLLTGGAGGVGLLFAREIARRSPHATIVLAGRSEPADRQRRDFAAVEALSARVAYHRVDVSSGDDVRRLVEHVAQTFGPLTGVIHAAGIVHDDLIVRKDPRDVRAVLASKTTGLVNLDEASQHLPLDFFIVLSSIAGALGNAGQADYAAANAFMDAYLARRAEMVSAGRRHGRSLAVNWPHWKDGGMRIDRATEEAMRLTTGMVPMPAATGMQALYDALGSGRPQVMVMAGAVASMRSFVARRGRPVPAAPPAVPSAPVVDADGGRQADSDALTAWLQGFLVQSVSQLLRVPQAEIDEETPLGDYGFDSITFTELANLLNRTFQFGVSPSIFFELSTLRRLASHLASAHRASLDRLRPRPFGDSPRAEPPRPTEPVVPVQPLVAATPIAHSAPRDAIAVVGMSGRFPMADDLDRFWENLLDGKDCVTEVPESRWDWRACFGDPVTEPNKTNVKWGAFIDGIDEFDASFFGISPREARLIDPQQRLLMMHVWKALEDAGHAPERLAGSRTAIYVGTGHFGYGDLVTSARIPIEGYTSAALVPSMGPNRISFLLDLRGPSEPIETACSSSLIAVHRAVTALRSGACDMAIVGGVNTIVIPAGHICFSKAGMLSPDGRCKTFSARADGYGRGEGVGVLVLERLERAEADGDHIYGLIRGSAENHGGRSTSLTAPNPTAQADVIRAAFAESGVDVRTVGYVEAHGTGTELGDPVEVRGLTAAFDALGGIDPGAAAPPKTCGLGSVKTNIGHLELAAGMAGAIKVLLQLQHRTLVKTLNCDPPSPQIQFDATPFYVVRETQPWEAPSDAAGRPLPRRAGVSSFGFGGVNAHVVFEEYVPPGAGDTASAPPGPAGPVAIVLSARTAERLREQARQLRDAVRRRQFEEADLPRIAYTLQAGRDAMVERLAFAADSLATLERTLHAFVEDEILPDGWHRGEAKRSSQDALSLVASDEDMAEAVERWMARGKLRELLRLWVQGLRIDWDKLYAGTPPQRISLPTYPFTKERYWVVAAPQPEERVGKRTDAAVGDVPTPGARGEDVEAADEDSPQVVAHSSTAPGVAESGSRTAERGLHEELSDSLAAALYMDRHDLNEESSFAELGMDSIVAVEWIRGVNKQYGTAIPVTKVYEHPTLDRFAAFLVNEISKAGSPRTIREAAVTEERKAEAPPSNSRRQAPHAVESRQRRAGDGGIAVIGMSGRYPDANNLREYWSNLENGVHSVRQVPDDRWGPSWRDGRSGLAARIYCCQMGALSGVDAFDPLFFNIAPSDAPFIDPQHRLFLQEGYRAFEDAACGITALSDSRCGVYLGVMGHEYGILQHQRGGGAVRATSDSDAIGAARLAYFLNLKGPALSIDTACSSSLVAAHLACQALRNQEVDLALVAGVTLYLTPESFAGMCDAGMLSRQGRCSAFDRDADGFVPGEGAGAVVLKRLRDAERDGNHIYGVIIGSGVNQDGKTNGITAPNAQSQTALARAVYEQYGIDPGTITCVEMHGTGTALGDPIELDALATAFRERTSKTQYCAIGSVKTNIGHTSAAAGVASMHKVLLSLVHRRLVPSLNFTTPSEHFDFGRSPFYVNTQSKPWAAGANDRRRAAASAFGFSGTNAHLVLEEYRPPASCQATAVASPGQAGVELVFPISAKTPAQLAESVANLRQFVTTDEVDLVRLAYTLQTGRSAMEYRMAVLASSRQELVSALAAFLDGATPEIARGAATLQFTPASGVLTGSDNGREKSPGASALNRWIQERALRRVATAWVNGADVEWERLYDKARPIPMSAPTYPFAKERYWLPDTTAGIDLAATPADRAAWPDVLHPFVHRNTSRVSELRFTSTFSGDEWFLAEHRVGGKKVLPAAVQVEMARAGAERLTVGEPHPRVLAIEHVVWIRPLVVETPLDVHIRYFNSQFPTPNSQLPLNSQLPTSNSQLSRDSQLPTSNAQLSLNSQLPTSNSQLSRDSQLPTSNARAGSLATRVWELGVGSWELRFEIYKAAATGGEELVFCRGQLRMAAGSGGALDREDASSGLARARRDCVSRRVPGSRCYEVFARAGLEYGPRYRAIRELHVGTGQALAEIARPQECTGAGDGCVLHPSILDPAMQAAVGLTELADGAPAGVPFGLDRLTILEPLSPASWAHVRYAAGSGPASRLPKVDVDLYDADGALCVAIRGFATRAANETGEALRSDARPSDARPGDEDVRRGRNHDSQRRDPASDARPSDARPGDDAHPRDTHQSDARPSGDEVLLLVPEPVTVAATRTRDNAESGLRVATPIDYAMHVVFVCELEAGVEAALAAACAGARFIRLHSGHSHVAGRFEDYAAQLRREVRQLLAPHVRGRIRCQLVLPSSGEARLLRGLGGLLKTAHLEHPDLVTETIAASYEEWAGMPDRLLLDVPTGLNRDLEYRDGRCWRTEWRELPPSRARGAPERVWRDGGVYLISGGMGRLGLLFAREIASRTRGAAIVLGGRSPRSEHVERQLERLANLGAQADYLEADVTARSAVDRLLSTIDARYGALRGVLHCAGRIHDGFLQRGDEAQCSVVMAPKVLGVSNLDEATAELPLDVFVTFSSIAGALGSVGQADYAAANAYMDAYAPYRAGLVRAGHRSGRTLSINWPHWADGGMHVDERLAGLAASRSGLGSLDSTRGLQAFYDALEADANQVMVLAGNGGALRHYLRESRYAAGSSETLPEAATVLAAPAVGDEERPDARPAVVEHLRSLVARVLKVPYGRISTQASFDQYGIDSINVMQVTSELELTFGPLSKTLLFEYRTIHDLAGYFLDTYGDRAASISADGNGKRTTAFPAAAASNGSERRDEAARAATAERAQHTDRGEADLAELAVIGLAGRYPGARSMAELWQNLRNGVDSITEVPSDRWSVPDVFDPEPGKAGKTYSRWGGFLDGAAEFDPRFFGIAPKEAHHMDPQERLFLQCAYACIEDAGYTRHTVGAPGGDGLGPNVGVFVGVMYQEYQLYGVQETLLGRPLSLSGSASSIANRVSFYFDFHGPSMAVDTMCSSSLTALYLAAQSLATGECDVALAGGVNLSLHPNKYIGLSQGRFVSSTGRCESFGRGGDGYVPSEGVGAVLLKPLRRARADGDHVYAVIKAVAANHGGRTNGYSVPNPAAQAAVIRRALSKCAVDPGTIGYVEAHGTGTALGDPIEIAGLHRAFAERTEAKQFCAIGSVKSNIGHSEAAAGIAGLTKVLLQLQHRELVPSLHSATLNPHIDFGKTAFKVQQQLEPWAAPAGVDGAGQTPRRALLSSFGAGGSNVHVVVEEHLEPEPERPRPALHEPAIVLLSAKGEARLRERARELFELIRAGGLDDRDLQNVAYTLQVGREHMTDRLGLLADSLAAVQASLGAFLNGTPPDAPPPRRLWRGSVDDQSFPLAMPDAGVQQTIDACVTSRRYDTLVDLWVRGTDIDWTPLHAGRNPRRVSLPTYPFARERYWVPPPEDPGASLQVHGSSRGLIAAPRPRIVLMPTSAFDAAASSQPENPPACEGETAESASAPATAPVPHAPANGGAADDSAVMPMEQLQDELAASLAQALYLEPGEVGVHAKFTDIGLDSVVGVQWVQAINRRYGTNIAATRVYDYPTIRELAAFLRGEMVAVAAGRDAEVTPDVAVDELLRQVQCGEVDPEEACRLLAAHGLHTTRSGF